MNERIKKIRIDNNLNQSEFAESLNLKRTTITMYEKNERKVTERTINDIIRIYDVNEEWLRFGTGEQYEIKSEEEELKRRIDEILQGQNDFAKSVMYQASKLSESEWKIIENIIYKLKANKKD